MKMKIRKLLAGLLTVLISVTLIPALPAMTLQAAAKTTPNGETVNTVLFYAVDGSENRVLVSQIPVTELRDDNPDLPVHNYSVLDRYVTTVHQEATGMTVPDFVEYASKKSSVLGGEDLHFTGTDQIAFWEIDQTGYDNMDTYSYQDLYGVSRYNFPEIYKYWNYTTQDYADPEGVMSRDEVIDHLMDSAVPEQMLLSVTAFSQRYMNTDEKFDESDYNMEDYWDSRDYLDTERTIRLMIPMTEENLREKQSTASNTRYWVSQILLDMDGSPSFTSLGTVAEPTAVMTEDEDNYYVRFSCATEGATIYFNHNYQSPSYMPTCPYDGDVLEIPKSTFKSGTVTLTAHAVKDGWADAGVVTLSLNSSGKEEPVQKPVVQCRDGGSYRLSEDGTELTVTADQGYQIQDVVLNGSSQGSISSLGDLKTGDQVVITFEKTESGTPSGPGGSGTGAPSNPSGPSGPSDPANPGTPSNPSEPGGPASPGTPSDPSGQGTPADPGTAPGQGGFTDVAADAWYAGAVNYVTEKGYFNGTSASEFSPDMAMTRAMFVTVLGRRAGVDPSVYSGSEFADVPEGQWYSAFVKWASQNGIVTGVGDGLFDPEGLVTREQMAAILYRYAKFCGLDVGADDTRFRSFADQGQVSDYAKDALIWATDRGIINGMGDGTLVPQGNATRAQVAQIVIKYAEKAV